MKIQNEEDYKAAIHELHHLLDEIMEIGGFDNMSKEQSNHLSELSRDISEYEEKLYGKEGENWLI